MNNSLKDLPLREAKAILQAGYQLIVSSNYNVISEEDDSAIDILYRYLGYDGGLDSRNKGTLIWNEAINFSPYLSFEIVKCLNDAQHLDFVRMIFEIVHDDREKQFPRADCAKQLFELCNIRLSVPYSKEEQLAIFYVIANIVNAKGGRGTDNEMAFLDRVGDKFSITKEDITIEALKDDVHNIAIIRNMDEDKRWLLSCVVQAAAIADGNMALFGKPQGKKAFDYMDKCDLPSDINFYDTVEIARMFLLGKYK